MHLTNTAYTWKNLKMMIEFLEPYNTYLYGFNFR